MSHETKVALLLLLARSSPRGLTARELSSASGVELHLVQFTLRRMQKANQVRVEVAGRLSRWFVVPKGRMP